jgi:hypothetical protein
MASSVNRQMSKEDNDRYSARRALFNIEGCTLLQVERIQNRGDVRRTAARVVRIETPDSKGS